MNCNNGLPSSASESNDPTNDQSFANDDNDNGDNGHSLEIPTMNDSSSNAASNVNSTEPTSPESTSPSPGTTMMHHSGHAGQGHSELMTKILENETPGCTCKKSRCLKLYCQCFAASALCDSTKCRCESCKNEVTREKDIKRARSNVLYRNPRAFEDKFTNAAVTSTANNSRKLPSIRRNFSAMRNPVGTC